MERQGGPEHDAEAQKVLEALVARADNLVARLDLARLAAKRGDGATLQKALAPLTDGGRVVADRSTGPLQDRGAGGFGRQPTWRGARRSRS